MSEPKKYYDASQPGEPPLRIHEGHTFDADGCNIHEGKLRIWKVSQIYPFYCTEMWIPLKEVISVILEELESKVPQEEREENAL